MLGLVPRVPPEGTSAEHMSEFEVPLLGDARRRLGRWNEAVAALCAAWRWLRMHTVGDGRPMPGGGQVNLMMLRTRGRAHCTSPIILGCSQRSRQVVEQKHARPCWISPVAVTR